MEASQRWPGMPASVGDGKVPLEQLQLQRQNWGPMEESGMGQALNYWRATLSTGGEGQLVISRAS